MSTSRRRFARSLSRSTRQKSPLHIVDYLVENSPVLFLERPETPERSGVFNVAAGVKDRGDPAVSLDSVVDPLANLSEKTQKVVGPVLTASPGRSRVSAAPARMARVMRVPCDRLIGRACNVHFVSPRMILEFGLGKR